MGGGFVEGTDRGGVLGREPNPDFDKVRFTALGESVNFMGCRTPAVDTSI